MTQGTNFTSGCLKSVPRYTPLHPNQVLIFAFWASNYDLSNLCLLHGRRETSLLSILNDVQRTSVHGKQTYKAYQGFYEVTIVIRNSTSWNIFLGCNKHAWWLKLITWLLINKWKLRCMEDEDACSVGAIAPCHVSNALPMQSC